jgi:predicted transcriptional regulator
MNTQNKQMEFTDFNLDCKYLQSADIHSYPIDTVVKDQYHKLGQKVLKQLARDLNLAEGTFDIRSNKAGIAVGGDITLHADHIYINICATSVTSSTVNGFSQHCRVMYRGCDSRTDYRGHRNLWAHIEELTDSRTLEAMRAIAHPSGR